MAGSRSLAHHVLMASVAILVGGILTTAHPTVDVLRSHSVVHSGRVMASQQTRRELGVERWVVYAEARTYGLRVVGLDDRGSLRGVIDPDGNVVSNSLSGDEWTTLMNAAERDLDAHPAVQSSANCAVAPVGGAAAGAAGAATCTSVLLCFLGGAACGVAVANASVECFPEEPPPPLFHERRSGAEMGGVR